jgi:3-oxoacyl-[acyl-carrier protein] reductase
MDLGLKEKVAVVTASSQGLGRAVAEALAQEGARVAICSRDVARITETGTCLQQTYGTDVLPVVCDVSDPKSVAGLRDKVLERFGRADIVFANAGGPPPGGVLDVKPEDYEKAIQLNLMSAIHLAYAFLPQMREKQWGRIIASTSITVKQPIPHLVLSNISRVGVVALIKSLARDLAPLNITANAVAPGYIMTERVKQLLEARVANEGITFDQAAEQMAAQIPARRTGVPEEFGALVAFLASERAAYINGETILIDGAMYSGLF